MPPGHKARRRSRRPNDGLHLVVITGLSGSGKGSVVKVFEDSGYYCVDNLPLDLLPKFVELVQQSQVRAAVVVDIREGQRLEALPAMLAELRDSPIRLTLLFLEASDEAIVRRFSETRRPHPLGSGSQVPAAIATERERLERIRAKADLVVDTSKFNVHELRAFIRDRVLHARNDSALQIAVTSFGFRHGVPADSDLVFDVRFLPNPNYIPRFRARTGQDPQVARYIHSFPQTREFIKRIGNLLAYLIPHYSKEGKSYLTIAFGCTGGRHRSVYIAGALQRALKAKGFKASLVHRDIER